MGNPLLILAGIPRPIYLRHKEFSPKVAGWDIVLVNSRSNHADLSNSWNDVQQKANQAENSAHILAFHAHMNSRWRFEQDVYARHRLVWIDKCLLAQYGEGRFTEELQRLAAFEADWRAKVRPASVGEALVLPEWSFSAHKALENVWKRAQRVGTDLDDLSNIEALLKSFRVYHNRTSGGWADRRDLLFSFHGERHAAAERRWRWKFTYLLPDDFHFDVRYSRPNQGFTIADREGRKHQFTTYTNVDSHGHVRGGH